MWLCYGALVTQRRMHHHHPSLGSLCNIVRSSVCKFLAQWTYVKFWNQCLNRKWFLKNTVHWKKYLEFYYRLIDNFSAYISSFKKIHECDREEFSNSFLLRLAGCLGTFTYSSGLTVWLGKASHEFSIKKINKYFDDAKLFTVVLPGWAWGGPRRPEE